MATCLFRVGDTTNNGACGVFLKVDGAPQQETAIHELYAVGAGYLLLTLKPDRTVWLRWNIQGFSGDAQVTSGAVDVHAWIWLAVMSSNLGGGSGRPTMIAAATYANGSAYGLYTPSTGGSNVGTDWHAAYTIGESLAVPSIAAWASPGPGQLSKMYVNGLFGFSSLNAPTQDWASGNAPAAGRGGFWNCRGAEEGMSVLPDDSGNGFDLVGSMQRFSDGPFAS